MGYFLAQILWQHFMEDPFPFEHYVHKIKDQNCVSGLLRKYSTLAWTSAPEQLWNKPWHGKSFSTCRTNGKWSIIAEHQYKRSQMLLSLDGSKSLQLNFKMKERFKAAEEIWKQIFLKREGCVYLCLFCVYSRDVLYSSFHWFLKLHCAANREEPFSQVMRSCPQEIRNLSGFHLNTL